MAFLDDNTGLLGGIASGVEGFIKGRQLREEKDLKKIEQEAKIKADIEKRNADRRAEKIKLASSDLIETEDGSYIKDPEVIAKKQAEADLNEQYKRAQIAALNRKINTPPAGSVGPYPGGKPTEYEKTKERSLAKSEESYMSKDRGTLLANVGKIDNAISILSKEGATTGPVRGALPDMISSFTNPDLIKAREAMQSAITDTLRPTLGAQFTAAEGERIMNLQFNPRLSDAENQRRANELKSIIQNKVKFQDDLYSYIRANRGSDAGFPYEKYGMLKSSQVLVSNQDGSERYWIDEKDLPQAEADGFMRTDK